MNETPTETQGRVSDLELYEAIREPLDRAFALSELIAHSNTGGVPTYGGKSFFPENHAGYMLSDLLRNARDILDRWEQGKQEAQS